MGILPMVRMLRQCAVLLCFHGQDARATALRTRARAATVKITGYTLESPTLYDMSMFWMHTACSNTTSSVVSDAEFACGCNVNV